MMRAQWVVCYSARTDAVIVRSVRAPKRADMLQLATARTAAEAVAIARAYDAAATCAANMCKEVKHDKNRIR